MNGSNNLNLTQQRLIRACIFDLDGVLVDTAKYHFLAWKRLASELGYDLTEEVNENLKGVSRMESLEIILRHARVSLSDAQKEALTTRKNGWFNDFVSNMKPDEIFPGVKPLLGRLRDEKMKIGLASSSKNAGRVIDLLGIRDYFDVMVDGNMITHTKPDPEIFLLAARKLNTPPSECLVFEDAEAGVEAAVRAGMKCVGIGSPDKLNAATVVVNAVQAFDYGRIQLL